MPEDRAPYVAGDGAPLRGQVNVTDPARALSQEQIDRLLARDVEASAVHLDRALQRLAADVQRATEAGLTVPPVEIRLPAGPVWSVVGPLAPPTAV